MGEFYYSPTHIAVIAWFLGDIHLRLNAELQLPEK